MVFVVALYKSLNSRCLGLLFVYFSPFVKSAFFQNHSFSHLCIFLNFHIFFSVITLRFVSICPSFFSSFSTFATASRALPM